MRRRDRWNPERRHAAEQQRSRVTHDAHVGRLREELRAQHRPTPLGDEQAGEAPEHGQKHALGEQLRQQARPADAER